jgi:hypothetical protein
VIAVRRGVLLVLLLALAALGGCSVEGRVEITSAITMDVDVTVRSGPSPYCNADIVGLSTIPKRGRGGVITSCRYLGTMNPSEYGWALGVATAGEYMVAVFDPMGSTPGESVENQVDAVDVTIVMPGAIQESNSGQVTQHEVRITDPQVLVLPGGLRVVSLNHAGLPHWVWWVAGGALVGALVATVVLALVRRFGRGRRVRPRVADSAEAEPGPTDLDAAATDPDFSDVFASSARPEPPPSPDASAGAYEADQTSAWARPSAEPDVPRARPQDPSVWAPTDQ